MRLNALFLAMIALFVTTNTWAQTEKSIEVDQRKEVVFKNAATNLLSADLLRRGYGIINSEILVDQELLKMFKGYRILRVKIQSKSTLARNGELVCRVSFDNISLNVPTAEDRLKLHTFFYFCKVDNQEIANDIDAGITTKGERLAYIGVWDWASLKNEEAAFLGR